MTRRRTGSVFFFQADDGIRGCHVTGVQTCALPLLALMVLGSDTWPARENAGRSGGGGALSRAGGRCASDASAIAPEPTSCQGGLSTPNRQIRSEERV